MASDMDKILEMSLDEYISSKKKNLKRDIVNFRLNGVNTTSTDTEFNEQFESKFKAERRTTKREEEAEEDDDDEMLDLSANPYCNADQLLHESDGPTTDSIGIWRGPSAETRYLDLDIMKDECDNLYNELGQQARDEPKPLQKSLSTVDLRSRLSNGNSNNNCGNIKSINDGRVQLSNIKRNTVKEQWRPQCDSLPNQQQQRQQHRQQLQHSVSLGSITTGNGNSQNRRRNRNGFRRRNGWGWGGNGNGQNWNWNNGHNHGGSAAGDGNGYTNGGNSLNFNNNKGRIQRPNQRNNQDLVNKNIKAVLERINSNNLYVNRHCNASRDITIERAGTSSNQLPNATAAQQEAVSPQADVKALLGVSDSSLKTEAIPMLAAKFLDFLQNGAQQTMHKPIYDMQIQKKIHDLQGKPLTYKCPSGEVVSSDGVGIDNCEIKPSSSGLTLNYRFG